MLHQRHAAVKHFTVVTDQAVPKFDTAYAVESDPSAERLGLQGFIAESIAGVAKITRTYWLNERV